MMGLKRSSWKSALLIIFLSIGFFFLFKELLPHKIFSESVAVKDDHVAVDEWMQDAMDDTLHEESDSPIPKKETDSTKSTSAATPLETEKSVLSEGNYDSIPENYFLEHFFEQLFLLEKQPDQEKVRIAYFGDSMTDGDLIVQDIRRKFQEKFGGKGVGFVPITSESANSRASIKHYFSKNWSVYSFMKKYEKPYPYGVSGTVFYANDSLPTSVTYSRGVNATNYLLPQPELFYGRSTNDSAQVKMVIGQDTTSYALKPESTVNRLKLSSQTLSGLKLDFIKADSIPFYGVNFDLPYGVQVDNFSKRGNSGLPLTQLNTAVMQSFQRNLKYDLIVLHFGTNVLNRNSFQYGWYRSRMEKVVDHVRKAFPESSVLVISVADKSTKYDTEMKTDSAVNYLLAAQKQYAEESHVGFVNLYALMGGEGSMIKWVEDEPIRANKDYTHFNFRGAKQIAEMIYTEIEKEYNTFKKEKEKAIAQEKEKARADSLEQVRKDSLEAADSLKINESKKLDTIQQENGNEETVEE